MTMCETVVPILIAQLKALYARECRRHQDLRLHITEALAHFGSQIQALQLQDPLEMQFLEVYGHLAHRAIQERHPATRDHAECIPAGAAGNTNAAVVFERDLSERLGGIIERATNGQWQIKHAVRSNIPAKYLYAYARLSGTEHLFPDGSLPYLLEQLHTPEPQRTTQVHPVSHEDMQAYAQEFALLQAAITHKHPCHFAYKSKARLVYPYKLIHQNGVWYLAAEEDGRLKNFSISLIQALQLDRTQQFAPKREHTEYINGKEDVWFTEDTTEVLLRIAPEVAHYFLRRALLPHQQQRQDRDGSLLVSTHVNHMYQLLPVVRYWLPHVRILQPCGMASGAGRQLAPRFAAARRGISVKEAISPCLAPRKKRCS